MRDRCPFGPAHEAADQHVPVARAPAAGLRTRGRAPEAPTLLLAVASQVGGLWVPETHPASCDLLILVD